MLALLTYYFVLIWRNREDKEKLARFLPIMTLTDFRLSDATENDLKRSHLSLWICHGNAGNFINRDDTTLLCTKSNRQNQDS